MTGGLNGVAQASQKEYTILRMRCYIIVVGTLFSVAAGFSQQVGAGVIEFRNEAMRNAVQRALEAPLVPPVTQTPGMFRSAFLTGSQPAFQSALRNGPGADASPRILLLQSATVCAIPLVEAHGKPTNDHNAVPPNRPRIDAGMAVLPPIPVCPKP
jgi:hypothetical protein